MKNISKETITQVLFMCFGTALMLWGLIIFVASFFTPMSVYTSVVYVALGVLIFNSAKLYFMFLHVLKTADDLIEKINSARAEVDKTTTTLEDWTNDISKVAPIEIHIDDSTTPEEIENMKNRFPMLSNVIDNIINQVKPIAKTNSELSLKELEKNLKSAIDNNEFEKAAEIRDEIAKRK